MISEAHESATEKSALDPRKAFAELEALRSRLRHLYPIDVPLTFGEIGTGYCVGRSSLLSVIFHLSALLLIVFFSTHFAYVHAAEVVQPRFEVVRIDGPIFLPVLGGGSEGSGDRGGGSGAAEKLSSGLRAQGRRGFAYPGPQPLVSDPPRATLGMQTILQPMLKNPPVLNHVLPLPNLVRELPAARPVEPAKPVLKVQSGRIAVHPLVKPLAAPKVSLSASASSSIPDLKAPEAVMPQAPPPKPVPSLAENSDLRAESREKQGLLVMNAIPPPPDVAMAVPVGEERSRFAVAPGEATVIADPASGSKGGETSVMAAGSGGAGDIKSGDALADAPSGGGVGRSAGGSGIGSGAKYGAGKGNGLNAAGEGTGTGRGAAGGTGTGSGASMALGSGKGSGSAPGGGGFPGVSIRGGNYGNGGSGGIRTNLTVRGQTSYGMTITSTASSGGGLPDFGIFHNEKVYTVYLDMRADDEDSAPSWTLQYAVQQPTASDSGDAGQPSRLVGTPTPPYATLKQIPELTPELAAKCAHKLIVASAILTASGKLEQIEIRQTPDTQVAAPLLESLNHWTFQPSQIDGKPVALRILLGIRLAPAR